MDIDQFLVNPKSTTFRGAAIVYNADAFTPDFLRKAAKAIRDGYLPILNSLPDDEEEPASESAVLNGEPKKSKKAKAVEGLEKVAKLYEEQADDLEVERDVYAAMLAGTGDHPVVMEWDLTRDGRPIPITEAELKKLKPQIVKDLWEHLKTAADPKSPEIPPTQTSPTISEPTKSRSSSPAIPAAPGPIM